MRDYADQIARLRECASNSHEVHLKCGAYLSGVCAKTRDIRMQDAADAIEELLARDVVPMDFHERCLQLEIKKRIELEKQLPQWISVEERLPEDQGDDARAARGGDYIHKVLAASVTPNYTVMDTAYLENGIWSLSQYTSWKQIIGAPVTHWMPLPAPPKGVE